MFLVMRSVAEKEGKGGFLIDGIATEAAVIQESLT
jgi:hypothetical protein